MDSSFFESLGLDQAAVRQAMAEVEKAVSDAKSETSEEFSELKSELEKLKTELGNTKTELETANATIGKLEESNKDNESLLSEIDGYKQQISLVKQKAERDKIEFAVDLELTKAGAINPKTVKPLIDYSKVMVGRDGEVAGVSEQVSGLKENEEYGFLFKTEKPVEPPRAGYEPLAGSGLGTEPKDDAKSWGSIMAERVTERKRQTAEGLNAFWSGSANTGGNN